MITPDVSWGLLTAQRAGINVDQLLGTCIV